MARSRRGGAGGKVIPNLVWDQEGTRVLNLNVLRRLDPAVTDILITAAHVVAYNFDDDIKEWSRKPVEGSLFVVKRRVQCKPMIDHMLLTAVLLFSLHLSVDFGGSGTHNLDFNWLS